MQPAEVHLNKPKIAKSSHKLPQGFLLSQNQGLMKKNNVKEAPVQGSTKVKSKNPFVPVKQCFKMMKQYDAQMKSLQENISFNKFSKFSLEKALEKNKLTPIIFENCLTISVIRKYDQGGYLKKILHVPTLNIYFLRESPIANIDKQELHQWIEQVNNNSGHHGLKIINMFWHAPHGFYSLLYQFFQASDISYLLNSLYSLPLTLIQNIINTYLVSHPSIYNSQIIIRDNGIIKYLPFYEEAAGSSLIKNILQRISKFSNEAEGALVQASLVSRLGITVLLCFFGDLVISQEIQSLQKQSNKPQCCLLHDFLNLECSLTKIFLESQPRKQNTKSLTNLICQTLQYKSSSRISLKKILLSQFLTQRPNEIVTLEEVLVSIQPLTCQTQISIRKLNKILQAIQHILQGVDHVNIDFAKSHQQIANIAKELGIDNTDKLKKDLQNVYEPWLK